jgi:hypothetical protein
MLMLAACLGQRTGWCVLVDGLMRCRAWCRSRGFALWMHGASACLADARVDARLCNCLPECRVL